ncbi:hypothetical protein IFM89_009155 [Coptis chinensis]|uniref:Srp40 C-terminal domain-containing protein n=1 Tax=Coptis chinensis TaxID=261450 RepID=A0A835LVE5_9MAGN|nr:hypothetical protein IFM89_009155 [Coptis chinensis]
MRRYTGYNVVAEIGRVNPGGESLLKKDNLADVFTTIQSGDIMLVEARGQGIGPRDYLISMVSRVEEANQLRKGSGQTEVYTSIIMEMTRWMQNLTQSICLGRKERDFRHEKTKKKRGSYRGGQIDLQTHSIKFNYSDEE